MPLFRVIAVFLFMSMYCIACKSPQSRSQTKDIDTISNAGEIDGEQMWTVRCASGWTNENGSDRTLVTSEQALSPEVKTTYCTKKIGAQGAQTNVNSSEPNSQNTKRSDQCSDIPARLAAFTFVLSYVGHELQRESVCGSFLRWFEEFLMKYPAFEQKTRQLSLPLTIVVASQGSGVSFAANEGRLYISWDVDAEKEASLVSKLSPAFPGAFVSIEDNLIKTMKASVANLDYLLQSQAYCNWQDARGQAYVTYCSQSTRVYDFGNILNTNLATAIPYTFEKVVKNERAFGMNSHYGIATTRSIFALTAYRPSIKSFFVSGKSYYHQVERSYDFESRSYHAYVRSQRDRDTAINQIILVPNDQRKLVHTAPKDMSNSQRLSGLRDPRWLVYLVALNAGNVLEKEAVQRLTDAYVAGMPGLE